VQPVRTGIVGAGFMGRLHGRLLTELPNAELVGVVDSRPEVATQVAEELGTSAYPSVDSLLEGARDLDAVVVATPEPGHRSAVEAAAARGCAVFVEKPIASNLADADAMLGACDSAAVPLMVGHILRHESAYVALKQAVEDGWLGHLMTAYARRNAIIQEGHRLGGRTSVVQYLAVHDIDLLLWYHDAPVESVTAQAVHGRIAESYGTPDFVWLLMRFADGALGVVECGWALPEGWGGWADGTAWRPFGDCRLDLVGTDEFLSLDLRTMNVTGVDRNGWRFPETRHWPVVNGRLGGAARLQMEHFLECVTTDVPPMADGQAGRAALAVCLAAETSLANDGGEVPLSAIERTKEVDQSEGDEIL
jgi:myo-inositol 2-dehydrogenase / D-chiro-inositol 1-dehydrogenase